jgi:tetraspanin-18
MGCGQTLMKIVLIVINLVFFLASGLMLAFGITGKANPKLLGEIFEKILPQGTQDQLNDIGVNLNGIIVDNSTFMIVVGAIGLVISVFGFVGACCLVRWMLVVYAIVLILLLLAEIALIIFAAVYSDKFKDEFQKGMKKSLKEEFKRGIVMNSTGTLFLPTGAVELAWVGIQLKSKCCGAYNYSDYSTFEWNKNVSADEPNAVVPLSCCKTTAGVDLSDPGKLTKDSFENLSACYRGDVAGINDQNCFDAVKEDITKFIKRYKAIAIGIAAGICALEVILIIFAFCLCARANDRDDKYV